LSTSGPAGTPAERGPLLVVPLAGMPEVRPGDDLARLLLEAVGRAGLELADGDVLAVTSKVVAKAEGRMVPLPDDPAGRERVLAETVAAETARVVARRGRLVIAETRHGLVGANALVDASNAGGDRLVLLPIDPDASAARLRVALQELDGHDVAVVVTDTLGRPWRLGQTDVAVGLAGMGALDDWRGRADGDGRVLEVTEVAVADEVAAAADLVKGKASRVPAALLRGVPRPGGDGSARDLVRAPADDLFRTAGTAEDLLAFLAGGRPPAGFHPDPVDPDAFERAVDAARAVPLPGGRRFEVIAVPAAARPACLAACSPTPPALAAAPILVACCLAAGGGGEDPAVDLAAGGAVRTLVLALHAVGVAAIFAPAGPASSPALAAALDLDLDPDRRPLGLLGAGQA
jgi:coenzyme F420-0:L-glutamate ligase / coenzyme F420-1:gamma-L-glutamate ligase